MANQNTLADLSQTASSNLNFQGQSIAGTALGSTIDQMLQKLGAILASFYAEIGGTGTVGGSANAITLTTSATAAFSALAAGLVVAFKAGSANTTAATINVDSLGAKAIRRQGDTALSANDILASGIYLLRYDTAYNSAAGAWVLLNPDTTGIVSFATAAQFLANTASKTLQASPVWSAADTVALTDAATIAVDMSTFINGSVTLGGNRTLGQPSNTKNGQSGIIRVKQDGTGSRTLAYHADWEFAGASAPTLSTTAAAEDLLFYQVLAANRIFASLVKAVA